MDILVVQHAVAAPIGILGQYLEQRGAALHTWLGPHHPSLPSQDCDGLIILGGPMGACDDEDFPHLRQVVALIQQFHQRGKPILGICLGAQLIARSLGGRVYPTPQPELGFTPLYRVESCASEPWLGHFKAEMPMMQWHFDTFELPPGAERLLASRHCPNQAFRLGAHTYGLQFHPEITPDIVARWAADFTTDWIETHYPNLLEQLQEQLERHWRQSARFTETLAHAWYDQVLRVSQTGADSPYVPAG